MSSETRGGRLRSPRLTIEAAIGIAEKAIDFVSGDTLETYLENTERQFAIERALIRYGEALKDLPSDVIASLDPAVDWDGPRRFRDLASHWYTDGLDHRVIWNAVKIALPDAVIALRRWLDEN